MLRTHLRLPPAGEPVNAHAWRVVTVAYWTLAALALVWAEDLIRRYW
jgi:hypothetical protein